MQKYEVEVAVKKEIIAKNKSEAYHKLALEGYNVIVGSLKWKGEVKE